MSASTLRRCRLSPPLAARHRRPTRARAAAAAVQPVRDAHALLLFSRMTTRTTVCYGGIDRRARACFKEARAFFSSFFWK